MKKLIAESVFEHRALKKQADEVNESFNYGGKLFRELFLKAGHALAKRGETNAQYNDHLKQIVATAEKLAGWGWPKWAKLKDKLGPDGAKKFEQGLLRYMQNQLPSTNVGVSGAVNSNKGGDIGKDDNQRAEAIAKVVGKTAEEILALSKK